MVVAAGRSPVAGYVVATASAVNYGQLLTTFRRLAFPRSARTGRLSGTLATPFDFMFPERATIWRCSSAETRVKKLAKVTHAIDGQVSTHVCV